MAKFNFEADGNAGAGNYDPVPDGEYVLKVTDVEYAKTSTKKHMLKLTMEVAEGPYEGRKVWTNIVFNPKGEAGHGLTVQALKAFGFEYDGSFEIDTDEWYDRTARAKLTKESYLKQLDNGEEVTRWKNVIPTAGFITDDEPQTQQTQTPKEPFAKGVTPASKGLTSKKAKEEVPF